MVKTKPLCRGLAWLPFQKGKIPIFCLMRHWPYSHSVWLLICLFWFWFDRSSWGSAVRRRWNCDKAIINFFSNFVSQGKIFYKYFFRNFILQWSLAGVAVGVNLSPLDFPTLGCLLQGSRDWCDLSLSWVDFLGALAGQIGLGPLGSPNYQLWGWPPKSELSGSGFGPIRL